MSDASILERLRQQWTLASTDLDASHEIYADDAVLEFPQSYERFEGKENIVAWRKQYPVSVQYDIRRIRGQGDLWVAELCVHYDGNQKRFGCSILEVRGDKIVKETIYIGEGWDAPAWRAPWRAAWKAESES